MDYISEITDFLKHCAGNAIDVLFELYSLIEKYEDEEQVLALQFFCENNDSIDSDSSYEIKKHYFTETQLEKSLNRTSCISDKIDELVYNSVINRDSSFEFYKKLHSLITSKKICRSKRDRVIALYFVMDSKLIPYMDVGIGIQMDDSVFQKTIDSIQSETIDKIRYIVNLDFEQKTQRCSLLLDSLLSVEEKNQQIILLSIILDANRNRIKDQITNQIKRL